MESRSQSSNITFVAACAKTRAAPVSQAAHNPQRSISMSVDNSAGRKRAMQTNRTRKGIVCNLAEFALTAGQRRRR